MSDASKESHREEPNGTHAFRMVEIVFPESTNHYGTLFAGNMLALMVRAAFLTATRFSGQTVVLAGTEQIDCFIPIKEGSIIELTGQVVFTGNTSLTIRVDIYSEGVACQNHEHAARGYFNLVAVDSLGKPVSTTPLTPTTEQEKAEWKRIVEIKDFRKQQRSP